MAESDVLSEIEVLQSIYVDELLVNRRQDGDWEVSLVLYPSTAEDSVSQFVRLTLTLTLDQQYPSSSPAISIHKPRGLSDDKISSVQKCLQLEAQSCLGSPVLYQLIEKAKEILTESNIPHGNCVICLYGFKEGETFSKTSCYHYFHSHCLGRYASHSERELRLREKELEEDKTRDRADRQELPVVCPVCREPLTYDVDQLLCSPAPQLPELDEAAIGSKFQQKWRELQKLLERQKSKGGIIDLEVESNRFLIHTNETPPAAGDENLDADASPGTREPSACHVPSCKAGVRADQSGSGLSHCRGGPGQRRQNQARGPRRGGRSRPQHRRAAPPITEHLDKLSLSSGCTQGPIRAKAQGNQMQQVNAELCQPKTGRTVSAEQQETECPQDAAGGRGHRGRRRGPRRADSDTAARGRYHWDGRASKSSGGGPGNPYSGGGGPGNQYSGEGGPGNPYSGEGGPSNQYSREGGPGNPYSGEGGPSNQYSREGGPGNRYSGEGGTGNQYSGEGGPGNPYSGGGGPGNQYSREGGPGNRYSGEGGPGNQYSREGGPGNQYSGEGGTGNQYSGEGGPGNQYSGGGGPGNPYSREGGTGNPYSREGGTGNPYSGGGEPGNPYSREGGPGNPYSREGGPGNPYSSRGGGGPHWSHDRGFQHKVVERERRGEEVL